MEPLKPECGKEQIDVRFFGNFQVIAGGELINDSASRARRPWSLLQYLMVNRDKVVSRQQLIEALWPDGASEQPEKALKNLVYRVRSAFAAKGVAYAQDVVIYRGGNYQLNNALPWVFDFELAAGYFREAQKPSLAPGARVELDMRAIELYRGDFLAQQVYEDWVLPYNTYYRSQFFECANNALDALTDEKRHEDIEKVCRRVIVTPLRSVSTWRIWRRWWHRAKNPRRWPTTTRWPTCFSVSWE